ncbi:DoxX family protein [Nocardia sp. CDC159]|uniref:DoxX family protein n=1 Tax=Nocardia pulmonis TaxID=2951408 RepID=A0A9X2E9F4_9NOCA|nr:MULTISPECIES: DoxX family protein [Nocardia]MCM6776567.1 DoxX family protein [Nocardia pulmonis]MCM6788991.1 DoxX family protein [Nocardia sp. CDC159]
MTDKPNEIPESPRTQPPASSGQTATSPYDNPTGELPIVRPTAGGRVPRTDDELGLEPEVPAVGEPSTEAAPTYAFASIPPAPSASGDTARLRRRPEYHRGTTDLGLLALRLVLGLTFLYHGLQKLTGWFHGPGLDGTRTMLEQGGWKHGELSAAMLTVAEVGGGVLILLGLATPLAAGAVLASITDAWLWKQGMAPDFQYKTVELESILVALAGTLILTGPGRLSFDRNRGWAVRPAWGSFLVLVLALLAAAGSWIYLHGGNPFDGFIG